MRNTITTEFGIGFELLNTATESGWYDASAVGLAEGERFSYIHTITFDPLGDPKEGDPLGYYYFL